MELWEGRCEAAAGELERADFFMGRARPMAALAGVLGAMAMTLIHVNVRAAVWGWRGRGQA